MIDDLMEFIKFIIIYRIVLVMFPSENSKNKKMKNQTDQSIIPSPYLYYMLISEYKLRGFSFLDMNGMTGDFTDRNPYYKVNQFKESFSPNIYEYIGEFDLVINKTLYQYLLSSNKLAKEFDKNFEKNNE